jgi:arabinosyltransferase A/arabinosyltransferase B/arabinosyltransferase C
MLSPPRPVSRGDATETRRRSPARLVLVVGVLTALAAVAFPFAPVRQPEVTYTWTPADGTAVALPLMPYQPTALTATVDCAAARAGGLLLTTVPPPPNPQAVPLDGLRLVGTPAGVTVTSAGTTLGTVALPPGDCTLTVDSTTAVTVVALDGRPVLEHVGDVRPGIAGIFTDAIEGLALSLTADTRFATTPTPLKLALAVACLLGLAVLLALLARADRARAGPPVRLLPRGWWRPRPVDGVVAALLSVWWVVGGVTVDDGYISGIVRSRGDNGFVGNVYRWLNAPEAPFSWFYEPYHWWSLFSAATPWMRLPSTLLGLLCWALVSRLLLPRLGRIGRHRGTPWVAALAFGTWWVPLNLGLRPEPWVAVGVVLVFLAVERTVATRRVLALATALIIAAVTTAVTPGGLMAFAPVLAAAVPLLRLLRARTDLQGGPGGHPVLRALPLVAVLVAAPTSAVLLMAADQSAAALAEAVRVRGRIGGGLPWYQEYERYAQLLEPDDMQGAIGRRAAVLATMLAVAGVAWVLAGRARVGIAAGPSRRLLLTLGLAAVAMTFSPTKWTQHFGDLAGLGTAALTLGLVAFGRGGLRALPPGTARRRQVTGLAAVTAVGALVLAGQNVWPFVSGWYAPTFSTVPPLVGTTPVATIAVTVGGVVVAVLLARSAWRRSNGAPRDADPAPRRWVPAPAEPLAVVLAAALALQVLSLARVAITHRDGYSPAADAVATATGDPCGLQSAVLVETDPAAGLLPLAAPAVTAQPVVPWPVPAPAQPAVDVGGTPVPGIALAGVGATPWYALDARQRAGELPVVVTIAGATRPGDELAVEFARGAKVLASVTLTGTDAEDGPADRRLPVPAGAENVRLSVAAAAPGNAAASLPRSPVLTPMTQVLPRGTRAILDWPVAFPFPCLTPEPLPLGTAALARWRVAPPTDDQSALITYTSGFGGPFVAPRLLVTERRMPTYLRGDPGRDGVQLYRWDPVEPLRTLVPAVSTRDVAGWHSAGHLAVPALPPEEQ